MPVPAPVEPRGLDHRPAAVGAACAHRRGRPVRVLAALEREQPADDVPDERAGTPSESGAPGWAAARANHVACGAGRSRDGRNAASSRRTPALGRGDVPAPSRGATARRRRPRASTRRDVAASAARPPRRTAGRRCRGRGSRRPTRPSSSAATQQQLVADAVRLEDVAPAHATAARSPPVAALSTPTWLRLRARIAVAVDVLGTGRERGSAAEGPPSSRCGRSPGRSRACPGRAASEHQRSNPIAVAQQDRSPRRRIASAVRPPNRPSALQLLSSSERFHAPSRHRPQGRARTTESQPQRSWASREIPDLWDWPPGPAAATLLRRAGHIAGERPTGELR